MTAQTKQVNLNRYETLIEAHIDDRVKAACRLLAFAREGEDKLTEIQKLEIAEIVALLTRTVKEMW